MRLWLGLGFVLVPVLFTGSTFGCATAPDPVPSVAPPAPLAEATPEREPEHALTLLLLVRHAEKLEDGTADPPLTERGRERATCLAELLESFTPTHLLTTPYQRTRATLEPLAIATGLTPAILDAKDDAAWRRALAELPLGSRAVVVGHSNTLPALVTSLGGRLPSLDAEGHIPHDEHDRLILVMVSGPGKAVAYTTTYCPAAPQG